MAGCVLLPLLPEQAYRGSVLMAGGGGAKESALCGDTVANQTAQIFDADLPNNMGTWRMSANTMANPRFMVDAVLLPDGKVLFANGAAMGKADDAHVTVGFAELFDPQTETFSPYTPTSVRRHYHGTALLLPDGRVALAGHTKEWNKSPVEVNQFAIEVISPSYLFRGPRPLVTHIGFVGSMIGYGQEVTISVDRSADIARVALIRPGSVTHQLNTDQRYVGLTITQRTNGSLTVNAPPESGIAPPGYYMLFVVDNRGVPSVGQFVRLG